jgi:hypothetical protein
MCVGITVGVDDGTADGNDVGRSLGVDEGTADGSDVGGAVGGTVIRVGK